MAEYTTGHCPNHNQPGGCQLHNLQCGWPNCDRRQVQPQPPSAASVSERARVKIEQTVCECHPETCCCGPYTLTLDGEFITSGHDTHVKSVASAIEQALTQQRGDGEPVAVAKTAALWLGENEKGERVYATSFKWLKEPQEGNATIQLYTTPHPSADAVRELVRRWRGSGKAIAHICADELESLLSAANDHQQNAAQGGGEK